MSCLQFRPPTPDMQQPPQQQEHTYPPVPIDGAPNAASPSGWAEYIKRLGKKDASVGVSRTWVKKGRDVDAKEESERGLAQAASTTNPTLPAPQLTSSQPAATPFKLLPAPPPRAPGRRPQESFYIPNDRLPHFAAMLGSAQIGRSGDA